MAKLLKNLPAMWDTWVRCLGGEDTLEKGKAYPLQYSGLENSMDCIVHGVPKSQTQLSDFHFNFSIHIGAKGQLKDLKLWKLYSFTLGESTLPSVTK